MSERLRRALNWIGGGLLVICCLGQVVTGNWSAVFGWVNAILWWGTATLRQK